MRAGWSHILLLSLLTKSMAEAFQFELVSPERLLVSEQVEFVVIPGAEGEMTVMANHAPVMTTIKPGVVTVKTAAGATERYCVFGGFADILPTGCTLLAESAVATDRDRPRRPRQAHPGRARGCRRRQGRPDPHQGRAVSQPSHHAGSRALGDAPTGQKTDQKRGSCLAFLFAGRGDALPSTH